MNKTFLYKWFGIGRVPDKIEERINDEKLVMAEEGIPVIILFDHFKAPGKNFRNKIVRFSSFICLTKEGVYGPDYASLNFNFNWNDPKLSSVKFDCVDGKLIVKFEASLINKKAEGLVEYRFKCNNAQAMLNQIEEHLEKEAVR